MKGSLSHLQIEQTVPPSADITPSSWSCPGSGLLVSDEKPSEGSRGDDVVTPQRLAPGRSSVSTCSLVFLLEKMRRRLVLDGQVRPFPGSGRSSLAELGTAGGVVRMWCELSASALKAGLESLCSLFIKQ